MKIRIAPKARLVAIGLHSCRFAWNYLLEEFWFDRDLASNLLSGHESESACGRKNHAWLRDCWKGQDGEELFDSAMTVLFTSPRSGPHMAPKQLTRLWHDPEFDPLSDQQDEAQAIAFTHIVFDEPEIDKILHRLPGSVYDRLKR